METIFIQKEFILIYSSWFLFTHVFEDITVLQVYPNIGSVKIQLVAISQNVLLQMNRMLKKILFVTREQGLRLYVIGLRYIRCWNYQHFVVNEQYIWSKFFQKTIISLCIYTYNMFEIENTKEVNHYNDQL